MLVDGEMRLHPALDVAVLVDQEGHPLHPETERAIHAEHLDDFLGFIGKQGEGQGVFLTETAMTVRALRTDASHRKPREADLAMQIADGADLASAAGREVRRVEKKDGRAVLEQAGQGNVMAILVRKRELRCLLLVSQHGVDWHGVDIKSESLAGASLPARIPRLPDPVRTGFNVWGGSSAGRASRSQCEGRGFDPLPLHHLSFRA